MSNTLNITTMIGVFRFLSMLATMLMVIACSNDNPNNTIQPGPGPKPGPNPVPTEISSYTIMTYGCGGRDLDMYYEEMIKVVTQHEIPSHINIVGQMKWSNDYQSEWSDGNGGVTRFQYNHDTQAFNNEAYADNDFCIDDPSNLAEFIEWARNEAPADEYIILFMGHGNAWHPGFDGSTTRAIMRDDEEIVYLGLNDIVEAFEATDAYFGLIYMMPCLMNSLEYVTELEPYANYYLASGHVTSITGGEIYLILEKLIDMEEYDETSIAEAVRYYIDMDYDYYWTQDYLSIDHTLTKCSDIAELNNAIREFTEIVAGLYDCQQEIGIDAMNSRYGFTTTDIDRALSDAYYLVNATFSDKAIEELEWYRLDYAFDIVDIAKKVAQATGYSDLKQAAENIEVAASKAIAHQRDANIVAVDKVYYTVTLMNQSQWESLDMEATGYEDTAFDKATGWSRILKVNNATYLHCR